MDEAGSASSNNETIPDLKDIEVKIGRKTPEGLLKCMREEVSSQRGGDAKLSPPLVVVVHEAKDMTGKKSLDEKIRKLKLEMAHLRSVDVKILQQLLAVHEGIEAVKWLMEERSTLTSRCSSLTSSQYSLGEGPDTSWRGSWSSLHDNDKLDNVSIGSYLDTLADDMDEYCPSSSESVICSTAPPASEAAGPGRTGGGGGGDAVAGAAGVGAGSGSGPKSGTEGPPGASEVGEGAQLGPGAAVGSGMEVKAGPGTAGSISAVASRAAAPGKSAAPGSSPQKSEGSKQEAPVWTKATEREKGFPVNKDNGLSQAVKTNGVPEKATKQIGGGSSDTARPRLNDKLGKKQSPKLKSYKNGKIDLESCKRNGKMHLEYDAHWRWVQSQEDVTFL